MHSWREGNRGDGECWMLCENQTREQLRAVSPVTGRIPWGESKLGVCHHPLGQVYLRVPKPRSASRRRKIESRSVSEIGRIGECLQRAIYEGQAKNTEEGWRNLCAKKFKILLITQRNCNNISLDFFEKSHYAIVSFYFIYFTMYVQFIYIFKYYSN